MVGYGVTNPTTNPPRLSAKSIVFIMVCPFSKKEGRELKKYIFAPA